MAARRGSEKPILIDTGMKGDWSPSGKTYENVEHPDAILAKVGFAPEDIEDVILTHLHFDHAGNLDRFPNATFHVQRAEYEGWKEVYEHAGRAWHRHGNVAAIIDAEKGSRHGR
jgi:glyoxylase-like metal-dependent hydrolase (beta-lactamase superfamily II)